MFNVNYTNIPEVLKEREAWCVWRLVHRKNGKGQVRPTKVPLNARTLFPAKSNQSSTWATFDSATTTFERRARWGQMDGIGFFLHDDFVGVDIDDCRDPETGVLNEAAQDAIALFNSYTEASPSKTGVRIFCRGHIPPKDRNNNGFEMYDRTSPKFLTVTGDHIAGTLLNVEHRQEAIDQFHAKYIARPERPESVIPKDTNVDKDDADRALPAPATVSGNSRSPERVLEFAAADVETGPLFQKLWSGDWQHDYPSQSEADGRLVNLLAEYAGPCPDVIDGLFRQSGLIRPKWDENRGGSTYGERTLTRFSQRKKYYDWSCLVDEICVPFDVQLADLFSSNISTTRRRRGLSVDDIEALPDPEWLIEGHLQQKTLGLLAGPPGAGKSFFALDMSLCVATGRPFAAGYEVAKAPVAYIYSEGESSLKYRYRAWKHHYGLVKNPDSFRVYPYRYDLLEPDEADDILNNIRQDFGGTVRLIVVDTLARNFGGGDENSTQDMNHFVNSLDVLRASGATILVVHHTGKDVNRKERGSSVLRGAADTILLADFTDGRRGVLITCDKHKDAEEFESYTLQKERVVVGTDRNGEEVTSLVLIPENSWQTRYRLLRATEKDFLRDVFAKHSTHAFSAMDAEDVGGRKQSATYDLLNKLTTMSVLQKLKGGYTINHQIARVLGNLGNSGAVPVFSGASPDGVSG